MINFLRPSCQTKLEASDDQAEATVACPRCATRIRIPNSSERSGIEAPERTGHLAKALGQFAADFVRPHDSDDYAKSPAVFLHDQYFGARTRIGSPASAIGGMLYYVGAAIFSWAYLIPLLKSTTSAWEFLPYTNTELVRINLRQRILWSRVFPVQVIWFVCVVAVFVFTFLSNIAHPALGLLVFLGGYVFANLSAAVLLTGITNKLARTQITLQYGFPVKYQLLSGVSDAPIEQQIEGVLHLCQALAKAKFSRWDQFSSHGSRDGVLHAVFGRVGQLLGQH
jgi:hypothetical protein